MSYQTKPRRYVDSFWFMADGEGGGDFFGALYRDANSHRWAFEYRFRYYMDDKVNSSESEDVKSGYVATFKEGGSLEDARSAIQQMTSALKDYMSKAELQIIEVQSDNDEAIFAKLVAQPWAHVQTTAKGGTT